MMQLFFCQQHNKCILFFKHNEQPFIELFINIGNLLTPNVQKHIMYVRWYSCSGVKL